MFAPFERLSATRGIARVGVGLTLARGMTEAMRRTLEPEKTPGGGLTMTISLPAAGVRRWRSSGQHHDQGGRIVASPVRHAVDEQSGGAHHLSRGDPAVDVPADTLQHDVAGPVVIE